MNNSRIVALFFITIICCSGTLFILKDKPVQISTTNKEKPFVIVIPSYNNAQWYDQNLSSVFNQKYSNYRVIYIDDCSTDNTYGLVKKYIEKHNQTKRVTLLRNKSNHGAMANHWRANHLCQDHEIIIDLDGDD